MQLIFHIQIIVIKMRKEDTGVVETPEEKIARLEAELSNSNTERDAHKEIAELTTKKLEKLERVQTEATIDIGDKTCKIVLGKGQMKTADSGVVRKFQFVKNEDGTLAEDHLYPTEKQ